METHVTFVLDESGSMDALKQEVIFQAVKETERETQVGQKVMTVVFTDGLENSSRETTAAALKDLIKYKEGEGWAFLYLGIAPDAWKNEAAFAGTGMANNSYATSGPDAMGVAMASASRTRAASASSSKPDVRHLVSDEDKRRASDLNT